jgi:opacity protein-like surface antigen
MNEPINNYVAGQFPLWLDVGYRFDPALYLGGFFSYGFGIVSDENQTTCGGTGVSCSTSDVRLGVMGRYRFKASGALTPWLGLGAGYEWGNFTWRGQNQLGSVTIDSTWSGFEFVNPQAGLDFHVTPQFVVAPFVSVSIGQFRNVSNKTTTVTPVGTTTSTEDQELADTSIHQWILFGVRAAFMP